jgi:asparagine synthase (glutamine-hydrolysing)
MCGISGIVSSSGADERHKEAVRKMNLWQARRGPDDEGLAVFGPAIFGHRRLSIIDLSSDGHEPMSHGDLHITFNGEIYNFADVKKELLDKGYKFKTKTDVEVILVAYKEWGPESFSKLRGMFAFALYDGSKKELLLVRDRYGIKPLYLARTKEELVFASTVWAIKESGLIELTKNQEAQIAFLLFGSVPLPWTTFKEIFSVPAGSYLLWNGKEEKTIRYYDPLASFLKKIKPTKEEAIQKIRGILEESVRLHMISDAPLGVFLSGGVDSSVISILAARQRKEPLTTLSIDFTEEKYSERKYREKVVAQIKSRHLETTAGAKDFYDSLEDIFSAMDQPTIDGVNTYFVAKAAKEAGLKAVLSGLGSDEIFFGYNYFRKANRLRFIQKLPKFIKWPLLILAKMGGKFAKLRYFYHDGILNFYLGFRGLFNPGEAAKILSIKEEAVWNVVKKMESLLPSGLGKLDPEDLLSWLEVNFYMSNQLLKDTDFMSMRHSIEVRVPFLDHVLVEYLSSLPTKMKLSKFPKELLISAMGADLPREVWDRPKMGFGFPMEEWLEFAPEAMLSGNKVKKASAKFSAGHFHWSRFWATVILGSREE